jgi:hypothetical protein
MRKNDLGAWLLSSALNRLDVTLLCDSPALQGSADAATEACFVTYPRCCPSHCPVVIAGLSQTSVQRNPRAELCLKFPDQIVGEDTRNSADNVGRTQCFVSSFIIRFVENVKDKFVR